MPNRPQTVAESLAELDCLEPDLPIRSEQRHDDPCQLACVPYDTYMALLDLYRLVKDERRGKPVDKNET